MNVFRPPSTTTLDKDLEKFTYVEEATTFLSRSRVAQATGLAFLLVCAGVAALVFQSNPNWLLIAAAIAVGGYLALNIGANDVANNVGPAVGARVLSMGSALLLAALCESAGALIAGREVVTTISARIVNPSMFADPADFPLAMMAALVASALWINLATILRAPVSTTHAVVGGVFGAALATAGAVALDWHTIAAIAVSWMASPLLGALIAALCLALIKDRIIYREDKIAAAKCWVPVLFGVMVGVFAVYLLAIGIPGASIPLPAVVATGLAAAGLTATLTAPMVARAAEGLDNRNQSLRYLFRWPLILAAAILSFAHGANDVANAVGPVAAIVGALGGTNGLAGAAAGQSGSGLLFPVLLVGAAGISFGLLLFGPRLVRMVGERITRLNPIRAFCVALATGITVLMASGLGLPVSSTHIAVGAVFGVGFYREWFMNRDRLQKAVRRRAPFDERGVLREAEPADLRRRKLVRRAHVLTIVTAWLVTVPSTGALAACIWYALQWLR
ncbi:inorganic phosphate transporter [Stappia taiwanensis]|uniref:Phosphate transporter n=1 Tax=Stappia taiwanensis TaxID=992267 RepID=A0A838XUN6_9HYPH|nr:inorganic phosphate transporter [Stappia taiwanensis]MBA4610774.1 inorganic phosphate transporter [Stappia taiwanensis]GGE95980.1 phosphate transporter [Stappia taiwanensis]